MSLLLNQIESMLGRNLLDQEVKEILYILVQSGNDWPVAVFTLADLIEDIENFIGGVSTKSNLTNALKNVDISKNAWQAESIAQLLDLYNYYDDNFSLRDITNDIESKLNSISK